MVLTLSRSPAQNIPSKRLYGRIATFRGHNLFQSDINVIIIYYTIWCTNSWKMKLQMPKWKIIKLILVALYDLDKGAGRASDKL